jgi:hypothetical protein
MKQLLKIIGLGVIIWGFSLLWPTVNLALTLGTMVMLVIGLGLILLAYCLGLYFGSVIGGRAGSEVARSQPTHPLPVAAVRGHFSRQTAPMPVVRERSSASRPTQPIPLAR